MNRQLFFAERLYAIHQTRESGFPSLSEAQAFGAALLGVLFPHFRQEKGASSPEQIFRDLQVLHTKLSALLHPLKDNLSTDVETLVQTFFDFLPEIFDRLLLDARAIFEGDPAAESEDEVIATYPGFYAIFAYRIAHLLQSLDIPLLPRLISEEAHSRTGIDIHPGAQIGSSFCIDHGTGVVIGETTVIGNHVKIYQGVSLGALSVSKKLAKTKRHPTIEDNVVIYANATVLGGQTTIGHDSIIGGNVWLTHSVAPYSVVYNSTENRIRQQKNTKNEIIYII